MQKIIVAVVSHGHFDYIINNFELKRIAKLNNVTIVIKDNCNDTKLRDYCKKSDFVYIETKEALGFGENNNFIYDYATKNLHVKGSDWFIILNPDVEISAVEFSNLITELTLKKGDFFAPNLFKDTDFTQYENSVRKFATYADLLNPIKLKPINKPYNKEILSDRAEIEWASGAFLCITFEKFGSINGFDPKYFMYYEDVDLCYRLNKAGDKLLFLKNIKAVHKGGYRNRSVFSKHFRWYLNSLFKFLKTQSQ